MSEATLVPIEGQVSDDASERVLLSGRGRAICAISRFGTDRMKSHGQRSSLSMTCHKSIDLKAVPVTIHRDSRRCDLMGRCLMSVRRPVPPRGWGSVAAWCMSCLFRVASTSCMTNALCLSESPVRSDPVELRRPNKEDRIDM